MEHRDPGDETDLDALAETQAAQEAEREVIDAAASLEAAQGALNQAGQKTTDDAAGRGPSEPTDPHAEERDALGFDLAWWAEEGDHNSPPLDIVVGIANEMCGRSHYFRELEQYGYDPKGTTAYIGLDAVTGPLVVSALQILGTLHSHIRDEVTEVLKQVFAAIPTVSEEQEAAFEQAAAQFEEAQLRQFAAAMGVQTMTPDEYAEKIVADDEQRADASNN